jgi:uncharacterized membrane protein
MYTLFLSIYQKKERVKCARKLLKMIIVAVFLNIVTGGDSWFHYLTPVSKFNNKILVTKMFVDHALPSVQKVLYVIFFNIYGIVVHISVPTHRSVTSKHYRDMTFSFFK